MDRREFLTGGVSALAGCGGEMEYEIQPSPILRTSQNTFKTGVIKSWSPTLSLSVPGDFTVISYNAKLGESLRFGDSVWVSFRVWADFSNSTGSGDVRIGGLPHIVSNEAFAIYAGAFYFDGITKANYTQFTLVGVGDTNYMNILSSGSGQSGVILQASNLTGGSLVFVGSMRYRTRNLS